MGIEMSKLLEPMEIIRDETGSWINPGYLEYINKLDSQNDYLTREEWSALKNHFNIDTVTIWMESNINGDDWEKMMDDCDITKWDPIAPTGFFLIDIGFGEDDAYAIFARNKRETELT